MKSSRNQYYLERLGNDFRDVVLSRTQLTPETLVCPREKSDMTPCVARDGGICVVQDGFANPICVGCGARIDLLLDEEKSGIRTEKRLS